MIPERHEKTNNNLFKNPYAYNERLKPRLISGQDNQGISPGRLNQLLKNGHLAGRTERVIQFLYECQFLTGHLIQCCFYHPCVKPEQKKLRNDTKNPYLSEIKFLLRIGAVSQYGYFDCNNQLMSSYIYSLTNGSRKWANERFIADRIFSHPSFSSPSYFSRRGEGGSLGLMWIQNLLSFNQFHIAMTIHHWNVFTDIEISHIEFPFGFYTINDALCLCAVSIRNCTYIPAAFFKDIPNAFFSKKDHIQNKVFIIITETIVTATEIMHLFRRLQWPYLALLLFTVDSSTKDGKNPLKDELIRFTGTYNDDYEICSLHI